MNKMGVSMTWLRSLPNYQHHPSLAYHATTRYPPHRPSKKMHPHLRSRQAPPNPLPSKEGGHLPLQALLGIYDSRAWRAYGPAISASLICI